MNLVSNNPIYFKNLNVKLSKCKSAKVAPENFTIINTESFWPVQRKVLSLHSFLPLKTWGITTFNN